MFYEKWAAECRGEAEGDLNPRAHEQPLQQQHPCRRQGCHSCREEDLWGRGKARSEESEVGWERITHSDCGLLSRGAFWWRQHSWEVICRLCIGQSGAGRSGRQGAELCSGYTRPVTRQRVGAGRNGPRRKNIPKRQDGEGLWLPASWRLRHQLQRIAKKLRWLYFPRRYWLNKYDLVYSKLTLTSNEDVPFRGGWFGTCFWLCTCPNTCQCGVLTAPPAVSPPHLWGYKYYMIVILYAAFKHPERWWMDTC